MSGPFILVPLVITNAMITSSTIAEPDTTTGEAVWAAGTSYAVGQEVIVVATHSVYENLIAGVNATSPELTLATSPNRWFYKRPTNKWAAFDTYISTQSAIATPLTYVVRPGLFNAVSFYGLSGGTITVSVKDAPGGTVFYTYTTELIAPPIDHYDYYFGRILALTKILCRNITPYADPEVTVTITAGAGVVVKAGMIIFGDLRSLVTVDGNGGTLYGARAKPTTFSYIKVDPIFGTLTIVKRGKATDMDIRVQMPATDTDVALSIIQNVLDTPCAVIGSDASNYAGLNVFGLVSGDVTYEGPSYSTVSINVRGTI